MRKRKARGPRPLTPKQLRFVAERVGGSSAAEAARRAGYGSPVQMGSRLMQDPRIQEAVAARQAEVLEAVKLDREQCIALLADKIQHPPPKVRYADWLATVQLYAKLLGFFEETKVSAHGQFILDVRDAAAE